MFARPGHDTDGVTRTPWPPERWRRTPRRAGAGDGRRGRRADEAYRGQRGRRGHGHRHQDPNGEAETLTYSLGGADAAKFRVRDNGQIEVAAGTDLDYETNQTYMVTVMAEDPFGA